ncbi:MAG: Pyrroline-5-carboxylate reductase [Clostridia bacterium 41_269]|nr:MAG: Pyrroline-5-carboxylate reductase [Clostridia bacterium 41_269]
MNIGFIGSGAMAEALIRGLLSSKKYLPENINCSDILPDRLEYIEKNYGVKGYKSNTDVVKFSEIIILAVKPNNIKEVVEEIGDALSAEKTLVSIAAGISTVFIEELLKKEIPVVRAMPNTPCLIGEGITALCPGRYAEKRHLETASELFGTAGRVVELPEKLMNAATALSGSGPAYIYLIIEALVDAGVTIGLPRDTASELVVQTVIGAAKMVSLSGEHPAVLKAKVMSPGGTTAAALKKLEDGEIRAVLMKAVEAAREKADKMN